MSFTSGTPNPHIHLFSVKPSAIIFGTAFSHASSLLATASIFGDACKKAKTTTTLDEFAKTKEAQSAAIAHGSALIGAGLQSWAVASLINWTGVVNYQAAACLGSLIWGATALATIVDGVLVKGVSFDIIAGRLAMGLLDTVGLAVALTWWGTRNLDV